jgi:hypothetical protein
MAFAKLSGSLLVRNDSDAPVSVPVARRPLVIIKEPERWHATDPLPRSDPEPRVRPARYWRGARLISVVLCGVATISVFDFLNNNYTETWRAIHAPGAGASDKTPAIVESKIDAALALPTDIGQATSSASQLDEPSAMPDPAGNASEQRMAAVSPADAALIYADDKMHSAPVATPAPEHEGGRSNTKVAALIERGDALFAVGDVASARLFYQYAAEADDGTAALRLGGAFDPTFLERARLIRVSGHVKKALYWYLRASELGNDDAKILLESVGYTSKN